MGSVTELTTSGDNDPEIFPVRYYRHYLYCDSCGSFELQSWMEPDNHRMPAATARLLGGLALLLALVTAGFGVLALYGSMLGFWVSLIALGAVLLARFVLGSNIKQRGLRCADCGATYAYGSVFFSRFKENPKRLKMSDVPRPLHRVEYIRGEELGPAPAETDSRLPP